MYSKYIINNARCKKAGELLEKRHQSILLDLCVTEPSACWLAVGGHHAWCFAVHVAIGRDLVCTSAQQEKQHRLSYVDSRPPTAVHT